MTILTLNRKELEKKIGKIDEKMEEKISIFGTPVEQVSDNEVLIEVFPNRPDLLSMQGFTRSFLQYLGKTKVSNYSVLKPEKDFGYRTRRPSKKNFGNSVG